MNKILAKFPEIEEYFGTLILTAQTGQALSPADGISSNHNARVGEFVVQNFALPAEYAHTSSIPNGQIYCEHYKLFFLAGDRVCCANYKFKFLKLLIFLQEID
jgi:hypothetical protein